MSQAGCCTGSQLRRALPSAVAAPPQVRPQARPGRAVLLPGGACLVGTDRSPLPFDGEGPTRRVRIKPFAIDPLAVTNGWFAEFVAATGYVTEAERFGWSLVFRGFVPPKHDAPSEPGWWRRVQGADWRHPEGPGSDIVDRAEHPVVHVSFHDATRFAAWAGGRLPSEAEWEYAAAGGSPGARYPWGDAEPDDTQFMPCNIWQGTFPTRNTGADGYVGTAPAESFGPNGYGLFNLVGNVWEWCADSFRIRSLAREAKAHDAFARSERQRLLKGGSYLCHVSYCHRYRIAARTGASPDSTTGHVGFRVVFDAT